MFASRLKKRLRQGAKLIVIDPRRTDIVHSPHIEAAYHLPLLPGTNVAILTALAHVIVTEGLVNEQFVRERCDWDEFQHWAAFVPPMNATAPRPSPRYPASLPIRSAARRVSMPPAGTAQSITASALPSTARDRPRSLPSPISRWRPAISAGLASALIRCAARTTCRARAIWVRFRTNYPVIATSRATRRVQLFENDVGRVSSKKSLGYASPTCSMPRSTASFKGIYIQGEDILQSDPDTHHVSAGLAAMECVIVQDLFLNETAQLCPCVPARLDVPGKERHVHQCRTPHPARPQGDGAEERVRGLGDHRAALPRPWAIDMHYDHPSQIMDEIARLTPTFAGVSFEHAGETRFGAVAVQRKGAGRHAGHAHERFRPRQGQVHRHRIYRDRRKDRTALSAIAHHRPHPFAIQCRRADAAYRQCRCGTRKTD